MALKRVAITLNMSINMIPLFYKDQNISAYYQNKIYQFLKFNYIIIFGQLFMY